ncbi:hypothetical protein O988_06561 [Pseudogymnoascus sp. VKM F-3808]|nr:hypothetical protein O988_06561 [Pseudogymnoascus sp. VKM F-3808]
MAPKDDITTDPPCHPRACAIQNCIQKNNYDESKCKAEIDALELSKGEPAQAEDEAARARQGIKMAENIVKRKEEVCEEEILNLTGTQTPSPRLTVTGELLN